MKHKTVMAVFTVAICAMLALAAVLVLSGCASTKTKSSSYTDSGAVKKLDSGQVKKSTSSSSFENEWWRTTALFPPTKDTNVVNNYIYPQPTQIIYEGGKSKGQASSTNYDSLFNRKLDSLKLIGQNETKHKETEVSSIWQIIGLCLLSSIVALVLSKLKLVRNEKKDSILDSKV